MTTAFSPCSVPRMTPRADLRASPAGFSLVELLVAMAVTAITLSSLLGFVIFMGRAAGEDNRATAALFCAQQKVESLRFRAASGAFAEEGEENQDPGPEFGMVRRWAVRPDSSGSGLLLIRVECASTFGEKLITRQLETLVCAGE